MSKVFAVLLLVVVFGVIGYVTYTGAFNPSSTVGQLVPEIREFNQPTGDVIQLILDPPRPEQENSGIQTRPEPTQEEIMEQQRQLSGINASAIQNSTVYGSAGESFGRTDQYKIPFGSDTFQIGTPVVISAKLIKVIPDTCEIERQTGQLVNCDYIEPSKFKYLFYVTCEFRDFCSLADISRWETTDNSGFLMEKIQTDRTSFTEGMYKASIIANSEVKDSNGRPYEIKADYHFRMIDVN